LLPCVLGLPVTSRRKIEIVSCILCGLGIVTGCADKQVAPPEGAEPAVTAVSSVVEAQEDPTAITSGELEVTPTAGEGPPEAGPTEAPAESPTEAYTPPFPDRVDLFVAPKRQGGGSGSTEAGERAVELMGFIRVDEPRAILSINGQVSSIARGESIDGIEVISVQPPSVLLRRGRQRWQATIE
jgi:hypothetical protein